MVTQPEWMTTRTGRPAMRSPGRPPTRRDVERAFWIRIAEGVTSEDAAEAVGASGPVGSRWFRERGGMSPYSLQPLCGRYLSFAEREEIALLRARGHGVRQIARVLKRSPSTISRELRRNAATRSGRSEYRASVDNDLRSHAPCSPRRPSPGARLGRSASDVLDARRCL